MKALAIIGLVLAGFSWICMAAFQSTDPIASIGWGYIFIFYSIAVFIVVLVKLDRFEKIKKIDK